MIDDVRRLEVARRLRESREEMYGSYTYCPHCGRMVDEAVSAAIENCMERIGKAVGE